MNLVIAIMKVKKHKRVKEVSSQRDSEFNPSTSAVPTSVLVLLCTGSGGRRDPAVQVTQAMSFAQGTFLSVFVPKPKTSEKAEFREVPDRLAT